MGALVIGGQVIVGYTDDSGGRDALALGAAITRVTGGELTVVAIYPPGSPGLAVEAQASLANAAVSLENVPAEFMAYESRGAGRGLAVLASRIRADLVVAGSADGGAHGRIQLGSTTDHLLHLSPEAVMLAPAGYLPPDGPTRLTLAYVHRPQCDAAVARVAQAALRLGVPLRLITFDLRTEDRDGSGTISPWPSGRRGRTAASRPRRRWPRDTTWPAPWPRPSGCPASCWSARPARTRSRTGCSSANWP